MNQTRKHPHPRPSLLAVALASCLALSAPAAFAQSTSATLRGTVTAGAGPASEGQVTATNTATGFTSRVAVGSNGRYVVAGLPPGTYRIDVSAGGQTSSRTVVLAVGQTATLDLPVAGASQLESVVVQGAALQETKTSEIATYVSPKQIQALPQGSRNFLAFADTVPGMVFETNSTDDSTRLRSGGQNSNGINVFIDGVGQKNYVVKGGITGQDSSSGNPFPQLAIGEYKVITSNYKAEFDQVSSAAVVAATKSGTNEFKGDIFYSYSDEGMRSARLSEVQNGEKIPSSNTEYGVLFSGPIIKDRMHYLFTYERKEIDRPRELQLGQNATLDDLPASLQDEASATLNAPFEEDLYFGKIDYTPDDNQLWELSVKYRTEEELTAIGNGPNTASYGTAKTGDDTRVDLHWQWNADSWMNDAHLTYEDASFGPRPITIGPGGVYTSDFDGGHVVINTGGGRDYQDKGQEGWAIQDDLTFYNLFGGGHTVKMGAKFKQVEISAFEQQPYNAQFFYNLSGDPTTPYQVQFGSSVGGVDRNITSRNKQFGIYVQDDWEVNDHLLINMGVRWDYEDSPGYRNFVTPAGLAAAMRNWANVHGPNVDYDIEDYISDGNNRDAFKGAFAPRLGFSYDLFADQRHVIFGGAGRSYDRNLWDYLALEQSKTTFPSYQYQFNVPGNACVPGVGNCLAWNPSYYDQANLDALVAANQNLGAELNLMNNNLDTPYSDQFSLGMRNVFKLWGNDWSSSVTFAHVRSHDGIVFSLGNRWPDGSFRDPAFPNAEWGHQPWDFPVPGYGRFIKADNGIETRNNSLMVALEKGYSEASRWGVTLAYTFNDAEENRNSAYASDEHYVFDYPSPEEEGFHRSLGLARHRLVLTGIVGTAHGLTLSSKLVLATPVPRETLNCHDVPDFDHCFWDPYEVKNWVGEKQWDIAAEKTWDIGGDDMQFRIRADLLNVMNWRNFTDYDTWRGDPVNANPNFGNRTGPGQSNSPRTLKLTAGFSW